MRKSEIYLHMTVGALGEVGKILRFLLFHLFVFEMFQYFCSGFWLNAKYRSANVLHLIRSRPSAIQCCYVFDVFTFLCCVFKFKECSLTVSNFQGELTWYSTSPGCLILFQIQLSRPLAANMWFCSSSKFQSRYRSRAWFLCEVVNPVCFRLVQ